MTVLTSLEEHSATLIEVAILEVDDTLKALSDGTSELVRRQDVIDRVLDVRQTLGRYYAIERGDTDEA